MAKQHGRDWGALRDEWVDRRLRGEALTRQEFAREKDISPDYLRRKSAGWQGHLDQREAEIQAVVNDRTTIDHAAMRIAILEEREPLRAFFMDQVDRWKAAMEEDKTERVELREVVALGNLLIKMADVGAGLPKEHVVHHDEVHKSVAANRRQMKSLESTFLKLADWNVEEDRKEAARKAKKAKKVPSA